MASSRISLSVPAKFMTNLQSRAFRIFDNTTNIPTSYAAPAFLEQKSAGVLTHVPSTSKALAPPIETYFNPSNYVHRSAIDNAYDKKGSRKFGIYPSGAKNAFVYEDSVSSKSDLNDDDDSFFAPDDASILARSSLETLQSIYGPGQDELNLRAHGRSPSRILPPNLPALIEAQKNYNTGVISVALPEGSVSSDSDTDSTITEGPYTGQDSAIGTTAMDWYYPMMSSRGATPQASVITPRAPAISQSTSIVPPMRPSAPVQRLQDIQTPMPRDSLVLQPPPMQMQDPGYAARSMVPRRSSLDRDQRPILPPGLSTSPGAHSNGSGQPSAAPQFTPGRSRRDSSPPAPPPIQSARRESFSLGPQPPVQPVVWDPASAATQPTSQPVRRDSIVLPPPQSIHRTSISIVPQPPAPLRRTTDPLPIEAPPPQIAVRRLSESASRGQGTLVSTRVRFNDENLICPSPIPMHERRKGFHNRRGDQLWTNKGDYKPVTPGQEYPLDLANYPDWGEGWMNEEGVRIDMQHRLIPKAPLRSALNAHAK